VNVRTARADAPYRGPASAQPGVGGGHFNGRRNSGLAIPIPGWWQRGDSGAKLASVTGLRLKRQDVHSKAAECLAAVENATEIGVAGRLRGRAASCQVPCQADKQLGWLAELEPVASDASSNGWISLRPAPS